MLHVSGHYWPFAVNLNNKRRAPILCCCVWSGIRYIWLLLVSVTCRSTGDTFARRPTSPDICHNASEVCWDCDVGARLSDSSVFCVDRSVNQRRTDTADRRTAVFAFQYARGAGVSDSGQCHRSEDNHGPVGNRRSVAATVAAGIARSVDDDKNAEQPACGAAIVAARCSADNPAVFCRFQS